MGVKRFEDLRVWQEARALSDDIAPVLRRAALADDPKLRSQLGAAVASIMSNIAEGFIRRRRKEFTQFLRVAAGSGTKNQEPWSVQCTSTAIAIPSPPLTQSVARPSLAPR